MWELQEKLRKATKTRAARRFYGCVNFPECDFAINTLPISNKLCPDCKLGPLLPVGDTNARCYDSKECGFRSSLKDLGVSQDQLVNPIKLWYIR